MNFTEFKTNVEEYMLGYLLRCEQNEIKIRSAHGSFIRKSR